MSTEHCIGRLSSSGSAKGCKYEKGFLEAFWAPAYRLTGKRGHCFWSANSKDFCSGAAIAKRRSL